MATSCQVLGISKDGHSISSLGNLLAGLDHPHHKKKKLFLMFKWNFPCFGVCPLPLASVCWIPWGIPGSIFLPPQQVSDTQSRSQAGWSHHEPRDKLGNSEPQVEQGRWWHMCFSYIVLLGFMFCFVLVNFSCLCLQKPDCHYWFQRVIWLSAPSACSFSGKNKAAGTSKQNYKWINW